MSTTVHGIDASSNIVETGEVGDSSLPFQGERLLVKGKALIEYAATRIVGQLTPIESFVKGLVSGCTNKNVVLNGVAHVAQGEEKSNFKCRHACIRMARLYLNRVLGIDRKLVRSILPCDISNPEVLITTEKWPAKREPIEQQKPLLAGVMGAIDRHLNYNVPAIAYVKHPKGVHVVLITGRTCRLDGKIEYSFLDPGTKGKKKKDKLIFDPQKGTCIREGKKRGKVAGLEYKLLGVYDYQTRMEKLIPPKVP